MKSIFLLTTSRPVLGSVVSSGNIEERLRQIHRSVILFGLFLSCRLGFLDQLECQTEAFCSDAQLRVGVVLWQVIVSINSIGLVLPTCVKIVGASFTQPEIVNYRRSTSSEQPRRVPCSASRHRLVAMARWKRQQPLLGLASQMLHVLSRMGQIAQVLLWRVGNPQGAQIAGALASGIELSVST